MAGLKISGISRIQANAIAMWIESGNFQKAFTDSSEGKLIKGQTDLGECNVRFDESETDYYVSHEIHYS
jgi:hypothetical protein